MIKAEFRVILIDGRPVKQWRDSEIKNDEWKNVSLEKPKKLRGGGKNVS